MQGRWLSTRQYPAAGSRGQEWQQRRGRKRPGPALRVRSRPAVGMNWHRRFPITLEMPLAGVKPRIRDRRPPPRSKKGRAQPQCCTRPRSWIPLEECCLSYRHSRHVHYGQTAGATKRAMRYLSRSAWPESSRRTICVIGTTGQSAPTKKGHVRIPAAHGPHLSSCWLGKKCSHLLSAAVGARINRIARA
jgi:hypothetical protein